MNLCHFYPLQIFSQCNMLHLTNVKSVIHTSCDVDTRTHHQCHFLDSLSVLGLKTDTLVSVTWLSDWGCSSLGLLCSSLSAGAISMLFLPPLRCCFSSFPACWHDARRSAGLAQEMACPLPPLDCTCFSTHSCNSPPPATLSSFSNEPPPSSPQRAQWAPVRWAAVWWLQTPRWCQVSVETGWFEVELTFRWENTPPPSPQLLLSLHWVHSHKLHSLETY